MNQPFEILIAEDNPADVALVREALKMHDINCVLHVLRDGEQALALLDSLDKDPKTPPSTLQELSQLGAVVRNVLDPSTGEGRQKPLGYGKAGGQR